MCSEGRKKSERFKEKSEQSKMTAWKGESGREREGKKEENVWERLKSDTGKM